MNPQHDRLSEYRTRQTVTSLRRAVFAQTDPSASEALSAMLHDAEAELAALEQQRVATLSAEPGTDGLIFDTQRAAGPSYEIRGSDTTGLETRVVLRMAQLPTSIYHLFDPVDHPLVHFTIKNVGEGTRRLRVTSYVEGYSARAVDTVELAMYGKVTIPQLPTLFPNQVADVHELATATVNVMVEDLDGRVELHKTQTIPLLARTTAPLAVQDPSTGKWADLSRYFGAFVTPNAPSVVAFLRVVAEHHPAGHLIGYEGGPDEVAAQLRAVFEALKATGITYVNEMIAFSPDEGTATQRVRLPRESLADKEANCIDGTVLVASILEAISLSPAMVVVPGHAFIACETGQDTGEWHYLETTMIATATFEESRESAQKTIQHYETLKQRTTDHSKLRFWPLHELRTTYRITPME
jgi:hypothetical protein